MFPQFSDKPLHTAADWGEEDAVKVLVEKGADVNAVNSVS